MPGKLKEDESLADRVFFLMVAGPFFLAISMLGFTLAAMSVRLLYEVVSHAGRLPF